MQPSPPPDDVVAARFLVSGEVQGVGFRAATRRRAVGLGLAGVARNLDDGRVEVLAEGAPAAVEALAAWLHQGPPSARVATVERSEAPASGWRGFEID
ncbi:acylphosphatase [Caldimonas brevitalea]|nr:acylphosphatase [Caldimonas brevitalea]